MSVCISAVCILLGAAFSGITIFFRGVDAGDMNETVEQAGNQATDNDVAQEQEYVRF